MARTCKSEVISRARPFHHCASGPPAGKAGLFIQDVVLHPEGRRPVVPHQAVGSHGGKRDRIQNAFSGVQTNNDWSGSTNANNTSNAWNVNLDNGTVNNNDKTNSNGNLTSQFFANVYLDALDQFCKHHLKARHYVRYCDDFVLLSNDPEQLRVWQWQIDAFLWERLRLRLNDKDKRRPVSDGIDFLGYVIRPDYLLTRRRVVGALRERLTQAQETLMAAGMASTEGERAVFPWDWPLLHRIRRWLTSYHAHIRQASSHRLWGDMMRRFDWLDEYFVWRDGIPRFRYPPPRLQITIGRKEGSSTCSRTMW